MKHFFLLFLVSLPTVSTPEKPLSTLERTFLDAANAEDVTTIQDCLQKGVNIDVTDVHGETALWYATDKNNTALAQDLITRGADFELAAYRITPLVNAVWHGNVSLVELLLAKNASVNVCLRFHGDDSILHIAVHMHKNLPQPAQLQIIKLLIAAGAPLNKQDDGGSTPLHWATSDNNLAVVELLLRAGAHPSIKTWPVVSFQGQTPLMIAREQAFTEIEKALLQAGATE